MKNLILCAALMALMLGSLSSCSTETYEESADYGITPMAVPGDFYEMVVNFIATDYTSIQMPADREEELLFRLVYSSALGRYFADESAPLTFLTNPAFISWYIAKMYQDVLPADVSIAEFTGNIDEIIAKVSQNSVSGQTRAAVSGLYEGIYDMIMGVNATVPAGNHILGYDDMTIAVSMMSWLMMNGYGTIMFSDITSHGYAAMDAVIDAITFIDPDANLDEPRPFADCFTFRDGMKYMTDNYSQDESFHFALGRFFEVMVGMSNPQERIAFISAVNNKLSAHSVMCASAGIDSNKLQLLIDCLSAAVYTTNAWMDIIGFTTGNFFLEFSPATIVVGYLGDTFDLSLKTTRNTKWRLRRDDGVAIINPVSQMGSESDNSTIFNPGGVPGFNLLAGSNIYPEITLGTGSAIVPVRISRNMYSSVSSGIMYIDIYDEDLDKYVKMYEFKYTQAAPPTASFALLSAPSGYLTGRVEYTITVAANCHWTTTKPGNESWITIQNGGGTDNGQIKFTLANWFTSSWAQLRTGTIRFWYTSGSGYKENQYVDFVVRQSSTVI